MAQKRTTTPEHREVRFVFGKSNYQLMIVSILVVAFGFILMSGTTDIYEFRKTILAPIVVLIGFALGMYSILKKSDSKV